LTKGREKCEVGSQSEIIGRNLFGSDKQSGLGDGSVGERKRSGGLPFNTLCASKRIQRATHTNLIEYLIY